MNTLQSHVSYLRGVVGQRDVIASRPPGYALNVPLEAIDVSLARELIHDGKQATDLRKRIELLRSALALWQGAPLAELSSLAWFHEQAWQLDELRLEAVAAITDARLAQGEHEQLLSELRQQVEEHPFREQVYERLMLALYRSGRQAEALAAYQRLRHLLRDELGIDPSPSTRDLESAILRQDPDLGLPGQAIATGSEATVVTPPAQLPAAMAGFTGREGEMARLDGLLGEQGRVSPPQTPLIAAVWGAAGVGKTTLAVHWAHRMAARFPDGQLYLNLRGYDSSGTSLEHNEALRCFLDALGLTPEHRPASTDALAGLYRSMLAGRRMLIVLDNARDADHVRPLLPASPGCMTLITSRTQLTPLVVTDGAFGLFVDVLEPQAARTLLLTKIGQQRIAAEPDAVDSIIGRCAGLPLALAIVAARAATHPHASLTHFAEEMRETSALLDTLDGGDTTTDLRAVLSCSYNSVGSAAARFFRLLSLHPGRHITPRAAASMAEVPLREARRLLLELAASHLLLTYAPDRYGFHDLLRQYALEQVQLEESRESTETSVRRLIDHFLYSGLAAARLVTPHRPDIEVEPQAVCVQAEPMDSQSRALAWFINEHQVLLGLAERALEAGYDNRAWQLAWTLTSFLKMRGSWHEQERIHHIAWKAAGRIGSAGAQAHALRGLAFAHAGQGKLVQACIELNDALDLFGQAGDTIAQARVHLNIASIMHGLGRVAEALDHAESGLRLCQQGDDAANTGDALNATGYYHALLGDFKTALEYCLPAVELLQRAGHRGGEAQAIDSLAYVYVHLGRQSEAVESYERAAQLLDELGDKRNAIGTLDRLADAHDGFGNQDAAEQARSRAARMRQELGIAD